MTTPTVASIITSAVTAAVNTTLNSTGIPSSVPGHVTQANSTVVPSEFASKPGWSFFVSIRLFGEAIGEQSESPDAQGLRWDRFGSLAAYAFSVYGISTFLVALILNRTAIIASSAGVRARLSSSPGIMSFFRRSPVSQGVVLAVLRLSAVVLLASQASNIFVALNVIGQTTDPEKTSWLTRHTPSSLFAYDPAFYADDKYMRMPRYEIRFGPTTSMLWPVFLTVSYSLFVETFSAAISNTKPFLEGGLTLFELSLAIQEMSSGFFFLREYNLTKRPTEPVLIVCLFSLADQISNQLGAVFYANKYRLIPSTMLSSLFVWYFCNLVRAGGIFSLPMEIALTYSALVLTLVITFACALIFLLTVVTKGARIDELNFANFFAEDHPNHELFTQYLGLDLSQDFYTAAINLGMVAVTQAGKSSYFMAYNYVSCPRHTWLEQGLWEQLKRVLDTSNPHVLSDAEQSHKILHFLNENSICGYNNIINKPSKRLISGSDQLVDQHTQRVGSMKLRLTYLRETLLRLFQLVKWALVEVLYYWPKNKLFGKRATDKVAQEESTQEFETRRRHAPAFIRHLLSRNVPGNEDVLVASMEYMNDTGVESPSETSQYLIEEDDSPDFELLEEIGEDSEAESEVESDVELIDFTVHTPRSREANPTSTGVFISPITELMTPDNFIELFQHKEILHHHLQYEYSERGMMTRSRYRALSGEQIPKDQTAELIDLILAKRRAEGQKEAKKSTVQTEVDDIDGIDDLDPRIACVICQTEPRTLITWPCKCFAICEGCRVSLVAKGMQGCVCCRQDVEGVSRVFLP